MPQHVRSLRTDGVDEVPEAFGELGQAEMRRRIRRTAAPGGIPRDDREHVQE